MNILTSNLAGTWYARNPETLRAQVRTFLDEAPQKNIPDIHALLVPHAGYDYSGSTAAAAYREVEGQSFSRALIVGPSHRLPMDDTALVPEADAFRTPLGDLAVDTGATRRLLEAKGFHATEPEPFLAEHSVQIQFPFLQMTVPNVPVIPLIVGRLSSSATDTLARGLRSLLTPDALLIVSSDFTHFGPSFGYVPFRSHIRENLERLDLGAFEHIQTHDREGFSAYVDKTGATICGADPIGLLLTLLHPGQTVHRLAYTSSGHLTGDWSHVVDYLAAAVSGSWNNEA